MCRVEFTILNRAEQPLPDELICYVLALWVVLHVHEHGVRVVSADVNVNAADSITSPSKR